MTLVGTRQTYMHRTQHVHLWPGLALIDFDKPVARHGGYTKPNF